MRQDAMIRVEFLFIPGSYGRGLAMTTSTRSINCEIFSLHNIHMLNIPMVMEAVIMDVSTRDCPEFLHPIFYPSPPSPT